MVLYPNGSPAIRCLLKNRLVLAFIVFIVFIDILVLAFIFFRVLADDDADKCTNTSLDSSSINSGLVLYFQFNNNSQFGEKNNFICDFSGNGNNGKAYNTTLNSTGGFLDDGIFEFNGVDDRILVRDKNNLSPKKSKQYFSVSFWIKFDNTVFIGEGSQKDYLNFLEKGSFDNGYEWLFRQYNSSNAEGKDNRVSFYVFNKEGGLGAGSYFQENLVYGEWIYITGIINGTHIKIYKNGILKGVNPLSEYDISMKNTKADLYIGKTGVNNYFNGSIDELRIYNRALADYEVKELYNYSMMEGENEV